jgi:hypothetical protein
MAALIWFLPLVRWPETSHRALSSSVVRLQISSAGLLLRLVFGSNEKSHLISSQLSRGLPTVLLP